MTTNGTEGREALTASQQFDSLYTRWSRVDELLKAQAVSPDLHIHLALTRDVLAARMRELNPRWTPPMFRKAA